MEEIKKELESIIFNVMLPESQAFLNELNEEINKGNEEKEIIEAKKDVESFLEELNQILKLIEEKKLSNNDARDMYKK
jgi:Na+/phosphate symporter